MDGGIWMSRTIAVAVTGIMFAAVAQFLSLGLGGGGHGWVEPFFVGSAMWIMLPLMAIHLRWRAAGAETDSAVDGLVLICAVVLDGFLFVSTVYGTGSEYFLKVVDVGGLPWIALWVALWLSWQIAALFLLFSRVRGENSIEG
jgi:hypothetical protein